MAMRDLKCAITFSCHLTSNLRPPNGDAYTSGPRYIIFIPIVHRSPHECAQPPARDHSECHLPTVDVPSPIPLCIAANPAPNVLLA